MTTNKPSTTLRQRLKIRIGDYPWDAVLLAMALVLFIVILASFAIDALWATHFSANGASRFNSLRASCYWVGDSRSLMRIAAYGYTDYSVPAFTRHLTYLPDRSWWPVFINLTAFALRLTGGHYCTGWLVNLMAMTLLPPVIQGITKTRRPMLMVGIAMMPFGSWLYSSMAEGVFLLFSGTLLWIALRSTSPRWWVNIGWAAIALFMGILVGMTKPNVMALLPGFAVLALTRTFNFVRAGDQSKRLLSWVNLQRALSDANPGWPAMMGTLGMGLGLGWWFYQTSGYYPLYVMMAQRTLWYKQFDRGSILAFLNYSTRGWWMVLHGQGLPNPTPSTMTHFASLTLLAIIMVRDLPPRWPGRLTFRPTPLYALISMAAIAGTMLATGQEHAIHRYIIGNIFFTTAYLRYVYGDEDEPPLTALPRHLWPWKPDSMQALLRLTVWTCGLLLLIIDAVITAITNNNV